MFSTPNNLIYVAVFLLAGIPRLNISLGPIPIYIIDLCILGAIYKGGFKKKRPTSASNSSLILTIASFAVFSEVASGLFAGTYTASIYMSLRMFCCASLFYLVYVNINTKEEAQKLIQAATAGLLITASFMVLTSLPGTRSILSGLFKFSILTPAGDRFFSAYGSLERGVRGQSLVGYNIISAWFVCLLWPMSIALYRSSLTKGIWKKISRVAMILGPFGILFAYSRGALLGLILTTIALVIFGESKIKSQIILALVAVTTIISVVGWNSEVFYFERIERRTRATLNQPFDNEMESERFGSYIDAFDAVANNPLLLIGGEGLSGIRSRARGYQVNQSPFKTNLDRNLADHSVFGMGTMTYGMIAAFCYIAILIRAALSCYSHAITSRSLTAAPEHALPQLVFASVFAMSAWVAFDKGIVMQPRGAMMFMLIIALCEVCRQLNQSALQGDAPEPPKSPNNTNYFKHFGR